MARFDLGGGLLYPITGSIRQWRPLVLSIEPAGKQYEIRTAYLEKDDASDSEWAQKVWAIQRVFALKEDGEWRLTNAYAHAIRAFEYHPVGRMRYYTAPGHAFNDSLAQLTERFVDSVGKALAILPDSIQFYLTENQGQLGDLLGLNYSLGLTPGITMSENHQVFSGIGSEWYPHELVHAVLGDLKQARLFSEGVATYFGGSGGKPLAPNYKEANEELMTLPALTFDSLLRNPFTQKGTGLFYATGAMFCDEAYRRGGYPQLRRLIAAGYDDAHVYSAIFEVLHVARKVIDSWWRRKLKERAE